MSATNNLIVLNDLPKFAGFPRPGEQPFKSDIEARTFLRTVENYFMQNGIMDDPGRIRILFSLIEKKKGNAINLVTTYAGRKATFAQVKRTFLNMYPAFSVSEFRHAAKTLSSLKISRASDDLFCDMTRLETATRAAAEAYLKNEKRSETFFNEDTIIKKPTSATNGTATNADSATATTAATPASTAASTTPSTPPVSQVELIDVIQNLLMHITIATFVHHEVYDELINIGPTSPSHDLMSATVRETEKHRLLNGNNPKEPTEEVIWKACNYTPATAQRRTQQTTKPATTETRTNASTALKCFTCGQVGHTKRQCHLCGYCKQPGHTTKKCAARIAAAKGKWCDHCKIADSHTTEECYSKKSAKRGQQVRMAHGEEEHAQTGQFTGNEQEWSSFDYDGPPAEEQY